MISLEAPIGMEDAKALVRTAVGELGTSIEWAGKTERDLGDFSVYVGVIEKFFLRNGSYASLTIVITGDGSSSRVEAIGSGAGDGLLNIGLGAHQAFERDFESALRENGYEWSSSASPAWRTKTSVLPSASERSGAKA